MRNVQFDCFCEKHPKTSHRNWGHATSKIALPTFECLCISSILSKKRNFDGPGVVTLRQRLCPKANVQSRKKKVGQLENIDAAKLPVNEIKKKLVRSGKSLIRRRECLQPGPFSIIRLEVTAV